jgi:hypothetical protein
MINWYEAKISDSITLYYSYETLVAIKLGDRVIATKEKYSITTTKHMNKHLPKYTEYNEEEFQKIKDIFSKMLSKTLDKY